MSSNKITDGVGKKIVEALKLQADVEIVPVKENLAEDAFAVQSEALTEEPINDVNMTASYNFNTENVLDNAFNSVMQNFQQQSELNLAAVDDMDLPNNVAVLKQLITKLPTGVSKHTGALIIKQTMEALGISMPSVLQEAQQVQDTLTQSVKECHASVLEYKKQITNLEIQAQKYQRQAAAVNDIISLFIQTN